MTGGPVQNSGVTLEPATLIALRNVALHARGTPALAALPGGFATRRKGAGMELADVREYMPGDDIRYLDRGVTARTGKPHIRQFQEERDRIALLVADFRPSMFWGLTRAFRSVAAAEVLALIGWHIVESGGRTALLAVTSKGPVVVPPRPRARGMLDVIAGLVEAHATGLAALQEAPGHADPPLDAALARTNRLAPPGSELFIASGFDAPGDDLPDRLNAIARRRAVSLILVTAAETARLPRGRYPIRLSDGRRIKLQLGGASAQMRDSERIAGRDALVVDAGDPVETTAGRLAAAFAPERAA